MTASLGHGEDPLGDVPSPDAFGGLDGADDVDERVEREGGWLGDPHEVGPGEEDFLGGWGGHATLRTSATAEVAQQSGPRARQVRESGGGSALLSERHNIRGHTPGVVLPTTGRSWLRAMGLRMTGFPFGDGIAEMAGRGWRGGPPVMAEPW
jgi:hypothetical protein